MPNTTITYRHTNKMVMPDTTITYRQPHTQSKFVLFSAEHKGLELQ